MAAHSNSLADRIPWTEEPGRLQFIVSKSRTQLKRQHSTAHVHIHKPISTHDHSCCWQKAMQIPLCTQMRKRAVPHTETKRRKYAIRREREGDGRRKENSHAATGRREAAGLNLRHS